MAERSSFDLVVREADGTVIGAWGAYVLRTAFQPIFAFRPQGGLEVVAQEGLLRAFRGDMAVPPERLFASLQGDDRLEVETLARTLHILNAGSFLPDNILLFVNFDPSLFVSDRVAEAAMRDMRRALHEAAIEPGRIVCELTEQKSASDAILEKFASALRGEGYRVAVDDYGAHDSDLFRIRSLGPDIVKFDAKWIARLMDSGSGFALLTEMVTGFAQHGIRSIFEGIEHDWQLELAEKAGASMVQGFILARPAIASPALRQTVHPRVLAGPG